MNKSTLIYKNSTSPCWSHSSRATWCSECQQSCPHFSANNRASFCISGEPSAMPLRQYFCPRSEHQRCPSSNFFCPRSERWRPGYRKVDQVFFVSGASFSDAPSGSSGPAGPSILPNAQNSPKYPNSHTTNGFRQTRQ